MDRREDLVNRIRKKALVNRVIRKGTGEKLL
jgi:hypothetical protein